MGFAIDLFHQPLIVEVGFFVVPLFLAIAAKFVLISLASLILSLVVHEVLMPQ